MGFPAGRGVLEGFRLTLRHCLRSRRTFLFLALGAGLVALECVALVKHPPTESHRFHPLLIFLGTTVLGFSLPLLSLFYSLSAFSDDREDGTLIYLLVRPVPRASLYAGKLLGALVAAGALGAFITVGLDVATRVVLGSSPLLPALYPRFLGLLLIGTGSYAALYAALALLFKRPAIVCLFHAFIWESFLPNARGQLPNLTFSHNLKALLVDWAPELKGIVAQRRVILPDASDAGTFLAIVGGAALVAGVALFCTREWEKRAE